MRTLLTILTGNRILILLAILLLACISILYYYHSAYANSLELKKPNKVPIINDPNLKVEIVFKGLKFPTSMAFLGPDDILVLEKNNGTVQRIVNGQILKEPLLDVNVATQSERGMLGITIAKNASEFAPTYVFLYYTEAESKDGEDFGEEGKELLGNRLYRYEMINDKLVNPKLLLDLPASKGGSVHNGGKLLIGPDNNIYLVTGDNTISARLLNTKAQNVANGSAPDGTSSILRISQNDKVALKSILGKEDPLNKYYAYGIRNSFGMDFDPVSKKLWNTENGPGFGDEINLVEPGFNSGWKQMQGIWKPLGYFTRELELNPNGDDDDDGNSNDLVDFDEKGKYSDPEFIWNETVGPTAIKFLSSDKLGKKYQYDMLVGDIHNGNIYHFDLNENRTQLFLTGALYDKMADNSDELQDVIFSQGFGGITDIEIGPDGYIYVLSLAEGGGNDCDTFLFFDKNCISYRAPLEGTIFRILTATTKEEEDELSIQE
jgi:glucose/arabinose dehydrogenase